MAAAGLARRVGWLQILDALWLFLPAYAANMSPVFSARLVPRWKAPIDGGRVHQDGRRVLGDGKTWRGLVGGAVAGGLMVLLQAAIAPAMGRFADLDFGRGEGAAWPLLFLLGATVGLLALAGDAAESFLKRRRGKARGAPWIPFDQLDFVVFGLAGVFLASPLLPSGWVLEHYLDPWILGTILVGTPVLHLLVNRIGYSLRLKEVPW